MKFKKTISAALLAGLFIQVASAQQGGGNKRVIRDAITPEELAQKRREAQANSSLSDYKVVENQDVAPVYQPVDIVEDSDIISFNGLTTLVPKRAILAIPDAVRNRIGRHMPGHRIVTWKEFHHANRGWISTMEVTRQQAEGRQIFSEDAVERIGKSRNLMVATYHGGPISVLPPREPEASEETPADDIEVPD